MYQISRTTRFKKDVELCVKRNYKTELLKEVIIELEKFGKLHSKNKPHILSGNYANHWECHIKPDWLLLWSQDDDIKEIVLLRTGTHSDLF